LQFFLFITANDILRKISTEYMKHSEKILENPQMSSSPLREKYIEDLNFSKFSYLYIAMPSSRNRKEPDA